MDLSLAVQLVHALSALVWVAGAAVLALILLASRGDAAAELRAVPEATLVGGRVLLPMGLLALLSGAELAGAAGQGLEAWVVLGAGLILASHAARLSLLAPATARALAAHAPEPARRALRLSAMDLGAQAALMLLLALKPGWSEAAILVGLLACLFLALALVRSFEEPQPA